MNTFTNGLYAHSGGVSCALNATAAGVIQAVQKSHRIQKLFIPKHGLPGLFSNTLYDTASLSEEQLRRLYHTPSSAFGSARFKLPHFKDNPAVYHQIHQAFQEHNIGYFIYNGGGDSQDTTLKLSQFFKAIHSPILCIGLPKTIDNDLPITDYSPGYGSCAKYVATSILEATLDMRAVFPSSTKVFVLEVMGRNSGWIAAASAMARAQDPHAPHIILMPERQKSFDDIAINIELYIKKFGFCTIVVAEGFALQNPAVSATINPNENCPFGHKQLGGIAQRLTTMIKSTLKIKTRYANADYLQRAAGHIASQADLKIAYSVGEKSVQLLEAGVSDVMVTASHRGLGTCPLSEVANIEKTLPCEYITDCGMDVTQDFIDYLTPYVLGASQAPDQNGLPHYFSHEELQCLQLSEILYE